jgi:8-oxo-dGTP pyrophosphatase MutT (NUDIX family)
MKIDFAIPRDDNSHSYCIACYSEKIDTLYIEGNYHYRCLDCGKISPRIIHADKAEVWWVDEKTREFWHESIGVFIFNQAGRILLFKRVIYPFVYTIAAGHLGVGEDPAEAAKREAVEETGIVLQSIKLVTQVDFIGDECKWGADNHRWHLYQAEVPDNTEFTINAEGNQGGWYDLHEALKLELTRPTKYFIEKYFLR